MIIFAETEEIDLFDDYLDLIAFDMINICRYSNNRGAKICYLGNLMKLKEILFFVFLTAPLCLFLSLTNFLNAQNI